MVLAGASRQSTRLTARFRVAIAALLLPCESVDAMGDDFGFARA
jgi:hypothetical protein